MAKRKQTKADTHPKPAEQAVRELLEELNGLGPRGTAHGEYLLDLARKHGNDSPEVRAAWDSMKAFVEAERQREHPGAVVIDVGREDPRKSQASREYLHRDVRAGMVYEHMIRASVKHTFGEDHQLTHEISATTYQYARDVIHRMGVRDPLEEMLVAQALWTHQRAAHLCNLANQQTSVDSSRQVNECADKASNTFRRLMLALAEYRRPPKAGDSFTAIRQANIATNGGQQVVQNHESEKSENATNEQGSGVSDEPVEQPKALPADAGGSTLPSGFGRPQPAMAEVNRPDDAAR